MTVRKLAIVGASARAAAFSAIRAGYDVVAADLFADADLQRVANATRIENYPEGLADWLASVDCDAWMYTGGLENYPALVDRMAALRPLAGNDGDALGRVRDPLRVQAVCAAAGLAMPETRRSPDGLPLDGSWLCKTYRGAGGSGVWALDGATALKRAAREKAVFQRFVGGMSAAAIFVVAENGARLLGMTRQLLSDDAEHPWQYIGSVGPLVVDNAMAKQLATLGEVLCRKFAVRGVVGVDCVVADGQLSVIEVNPRYTASSEILERASGASTVAAHIAACDRVHAGNVLDAAIWPAANLRTSAIHGKSIVFAPRDAIVSQAFHDWALGMSSVDFAENQLADIPQAGERIPARRPVLTAFASAATVEQCERRLAERLAEVTARLYDR